MQAAWWLFIKTLDFTKHKIIKKDRQSGTSLSVQQLGFIASSVFLGFVVDEW
jgi:hypothetical protein